MSDRRWNSRIQINIPCAVTINDCDYLGMIRDMSEEGLSFVLNEKPMVQIGQKAIIQVHDSYTFLNKDKLMFFTEQVVIKNAIITKKGYLRVGCKVTSRGYQKMVEEIKTDIYMRHISKSRTI